MATAKKAVRKSAVKKTAKVSLGRKPALGNAQTYKWDEDGEVLLRIRKTASGVAIGSRKSGATLRWDSDGLVLIFLQRVGNGIKIPIPKPKKINLRHFSKMKIPEPKPKESTK